MDLKFKWIKKDTGHWIKPIFSEDKNVSIFNIIDYILYTHVEKPYCLFKEALIEFNHSDLESGDFDKHINFYYKDLNELKKNEGSKYLEFVAECIAEDTMFNKDSKESKEFKKFFINNTEPLFDQIDDFCDEVSVILENY